MRNALLKHDRGRTWIEFRFGAGIVLPHAIEITHISGTNRSLFSNALVISFELVLICAPPHLRLFRVGIISH